MSHPQPALTDDLRLAGLLSDAAIEAVEWSGPRRWWGGPLDVEGLTLGSVGLAAAALHELTGLAVGVNSSRVAAAFDSLGHLRIDGRRPQAFADLSGFFPTADGWIRTHANYPHHAERLLAALDVATPESLRRVLADLPGREAEDRIVAAGGVAAAVRPHLPVAPRPWITRVPVPPSGRTPWRPAHAADRPLRGLRVLDLTRVVAGPAATRLLGALGADVLRIDPPQLPEERSLHLDMDFAKRSAVVDLRDRHAQRRVADLLDSADVAVLGYRPDALRGLGLDPATLAERYPHLVIVSLSAWLPDGPWAQRRGFDSIVQAATGIADRYRREDGSPGTLPVQALDHASGYGIAATVLALLASRTRGAEGERASLSLEGTAEVLFRLDPPDAPVVPLGDPTVLSVRGPWGRLDYVPPPLRLAGVDLDYPAAPQRFGADDLRWRDRPAR